MKIKYWQLSGLAMIMAIQSCGSEEPADTGSIESVVSSPLSLSQLTLSDERPQTPATLSVAAADESGIDLTIASVVPPVSNDEHWSFNIEVADLNTNNYQRDNLSFMLELSQVQDLSLIHI